MKTHRLIQSLTLIAMLAAFTSSSMANSGYGEKIKFFYDAFNKNDPALLDKILAVDWESISPSPGQAPGREGFKPSVADSSKVFADLKISNDDIIEADNKVVVRSTVEGINIGSFAGFPAKNRPIKIMAIDIHEFNEDGMVIRTWHLEDWMAGLFQMGVFEK
ncbi:MAG: ester cyclase [Granulosicoccus sp.]